MNCDPKQKFILNVYDPLSPNHNTAVGACLYNFQWLHYTKIILQRFFCSVRLFYTTLVFKSIQLVLSPIKIYQQLLNVCLYTLKHWLSFEDEQCEIYGTVYPIC